MRDISEPKRSVGRAKTKPARTSQGLNVNVDLIPRMNWLKAKTGKSLADIYNEALDLYLDTEGVPAVVESIPQVRKGVSL